MVWVGPGRVTYVTESARVDLPQCMGANGAPYDAQFIKPANTIVSELKLQT